jgi:hypothetical protein
MPVIGQTRILPQALESTWEKLHAAAAKLAGKRKTAGGKRQVSIPKKRTR